MADTEPFRFNFSNLEEGLASAEKTDEPSDAAPEDDQEPLEKQAAEEVDVGRQVGN